MRLIGTLLLVFCIVLALAAIWVTAHWWQLLLTAALSFIVAGALLGRPVQR